MTTDGQMVTRTGRIARSSLARRSLLGLGLGALLAGFDAAQVRFAAVSARQGATAVPAAPSVTVVAAGADGRLVRHALGETRVPAAPERVVATYPTVVDGMLALGVVPAGIATFDGVAPYTWLADRLAGVTIVGTLGVDDPEAILAAAPDVLVVADDQAGDGAYDQLSRIAPTVVLFDPQTDFRRTLREIGAVLGLGVEAEARLAGFEEHAADARRRLDAAVGDEPVAVVALYEDEIRLYGTASPAGTLYDDLGLAPAALTPTGLVDGAWNIALSLEALPDLGADHLFLASDNPQRTAELISTSVWQAVPAVAQGNVYPLSEEGFDAWWGNVIGKERLIADVLAALAPGAATPTP